MGPTATIPAQVADISLDWLNEALATSRSTSFGRISSFEVERLGEGVGELARLTPTYEAGQIYLREVNVYREIAAQLGIRVPVAYHVDAAADGLPFIVLIEDISRVRPDQIAGISPTEAGQIIDVVARLHAPYWNSPMLDAMTWLAPMNNPLYKGGQEMALARFAGFAERFGERIGVEMLGHIERACNNYAAMLDYVAGRGHTTFTHTDCRAENYLFGGFAGADVVTMLDFQLCTRHFGPWDVANLLSGSMTPEVRRECETRLVEQYHQRLVQLGVQDYSLDRCWHDYRLSLLQSCIASVIVSDLQGGNERGNELLENLFLRPIIAATDHHIGELLADFC